MKYATLFISIASIVIASATFYLTQLRPTNLTPTIGPTIKAYYVADGGLSLIVPVAITNESSTEGSVERAAITLYRKDAPQQRFFISWARFVTYRFKVDNFSVFIGPGGKLEGDVLAQNVKVRGHMKGKINAKGKVEITQEAHYSGEITSKSILVEKGAFFDALVKLGQG